jgi:hypothetical protein
MGDREACYRSPNTDVCAMKKETLAAIEKRWRWDVDEHERQ